MGSKLTLKDLTKAELLELLDKYVFSVSDKEIIRVRYNSLIRKAGAASAKAITDMNSPEKHRNEKDQKSNRNSALKKYDQAMRLIHRAEKLRTTEAFRAA